MYFKLESLPYGLQQRMRDLATDYQALRTQVALGKTQHNFTPDVQYFASTPDLMDTVLEYDPFQAMNFLLKNVFVSEKYEDAFFTELPLRDQRLVNLDTIVLDGCHIVENTFQKLQRHYLSIPRTLIMNSCQFQQKIPLRAIFEDLSGLENVAVHDGLLNNGWLQDIFLAKKAGLKVLEFCGTYDNVFSFDPPKLHEFFMKQHDTFQLSIELVIGETEQLTTIKSMVLKNIDKRFVQTVDADESCRILYLFLNDGSDNNEPLYFACNNE